MLATPTDVQRALNESIAKGAQVFRLPGQDLSFRDVRFVVAHARDLVIEGSGTTLWFRIGGGVYLTDCHNVSMRNLTVDYDPLPYLQATALADAVPTGSGGFTIDMEVDPGALGPDEYQKYSDQPWNMFSMGPQWWEPGADGLFTLPPYKNTERFNASLHVSSRGPGNRFTLNWCDGDWGRALPSKGHKMTAAGRQGVTLNTFNSSRCSFSHVNIYSASFSAITEFGGVGGHAYTDMYVGRRKVSSASQRCGVGGDRLCLGLWATNGDMFHSSAVKWGATLTRVDFSYAVDDHMDVTSRTQIVAAALSPSSILVIDARVSTHMDGNPNLPPYDAPEDAMWGAVETMPNVAPGDTVTMRSPKTLALIGQATVAALHRSTDDEALMKIADGTRARLNAPSCGATPAQLPFSFRDRGAGHPSHLWVVNLTKPLPAGAADCALLQVDGWGGDGLVVQDSYFHHCQYGIRFKSSGARFVRNRWEGAQLSVPWIGLQVSPLPEGGEGPLQTFNVLIANNTFTGLPASRSDELIAVCKGIENNFSYVSCGNITARGNRFLPEPSYKGSDDAMGHAKHC